MKEIPPFSANLIEELDKEYPHRCPDPSDNERQIWMKVGARQLVDRLLTRLKKTEQKTLVPTSVQTGSKGASS